MSNMALELSRDNFEAEIARAEHPMLVDFWGPQCRSCLAMMPAIDWLEQHYSGRLKVAKVDVTKNRPLCVKLRILSVPSVILYRGGTEVTRIVGDDVTEEGVKEAVEAVLQ